MDPEFNSYYMPIPTRRGYYPPGPPYGCQGYGYGYPPAIIDCYNKFNSYGPNDISGDCRCGRCGNNEL